MSAACHRLRFYIQVRDSNNRREAGHSTDVVLFFTRFQRKIASVSHTAKPSDFSKPPTHPACTIRPADTPGGSPCRLSSGSWALRAISNFPPHFRFFITGQARPQARLLNGAACTDPRARVFNTALSAFPDSPVCLQCGPAGRTPAPPHAALPGLATPRSPALASILLRTDFPKGSSPHPFAACRAASCATNQLRAATAFYQPATNAQVLAT